MMWMLLLKYLWTRRTHSALELVLFFLDQLSEKDLDTLECALDVVRLHRGEGRSCSVDDAK